MRHCITLEDFSADELRAILNIAVEIKAEPERFATALQGKWLLMLFQKTSTRTRLSFEVGMGKLGGRAVVMDWDSSNFSISPIEYESRYVSTIIDVVMARLKLHKDTMALAENSRVPVINGCDDKFHPCQALADLLTIHEQSGGIEGQTLAYVGVHNNVANSLALGMSRLNGKLILVTPEVNEASNDPEKMERVLASGHVERTLDMKSAVKRANFVYTDTWVDMEHFNAPSYQEEKERRIRKMLPYQLNAENLAGSDAYILHDMPIHPGYEISADMVHAPNSLIFRQAENRMYVQQALLMFLLGAL